MELKVLLSGKNEWIKNSTRIHCLIYYLSLKFCDNLNSLVKFLISKLFKCIP